MVADIRSVVRFFKYCIYNSIQQQKTHTENTIQTSLNEVYFIKKTENKTYLQRLKQFHLKR